MSKITRLNKNLQWRLSAADDRYLRAQANACRYYAVEGVNKNRWNPATILEEVYVPLELSGRLNQSGFAESMAMGEAIGRVAPVETKPQYIWDVLRQVVEQPDCKHIEIIAPGGFGKTTLLRHVTYRYSHEPSRICKDEQVPSLIPVLLYLRECRNDIAQADGPDLPTLIAEHHVKKLSSKLVELDIDWAKKLLNGGKALVMIDGFDEVAANQCEAVSEWIDRAIRDYGTTTTFILTTRPAGHERYQGQQPLKLARVKAFTDEQRNEFLQRWYRCQLKNERFGQNSDSAEEEAAREATDLIEQIEQRHEMADMADNPLLLVMIATYHKNNPARSLPLVRHQLYKDFCQMLLQDRPRSKKMTIMLSAEESQAVLQRVALEMVQQDCIALPVDEMTQRVAQSLSQCREYLGGATVSARDLVKEVEEVSELLVRRQSSDEYEFAHRSFQEYLAAAEVKRRQEDGLLLELKPEWRDTVVLYAALENPTSLIEQLCERGDREALDLAYDCWMEKHNLVPVETFERLQEECYAQLEQYMVAGDWRAANQYNCRLMSQVLGKRPGYYFSAKTFPCNDLLRIDRLWKTHSQGRFGFSVQRDIYVECGGVLDGEFSEKPFVKFIQAVGWCKEDAKQYDSFKELYGDSALRNYAQFIFSSEKGVCGHLPSWSSWELMMAVVEVVKGEIGRLKDSDSWDFLLGLDLVSRIQTCEL
ncbi:MAG: GUN4 domain-containing protein [Phormidesmis sp.]